MSVYLPNIPQANDVISVSQGQLLTNFQQIDDGAGNGISNDHVSLTDGTSANRGHHAQVRFVQVADPTTSASQLALYAKDVAGTPRLFIREESDGTIYQLNANTPSAAANGYTWLPGGILFQWGTFTWTGNNATQSENFNVAFSTIYQVIPTTNATGRDAAVTALNPGAPGSATYAITNPTAGIVIRWMAVGAA